MFVVSVCSLKGGVGKTSLVLGLAAAAMRRGQATLVVDLDPQGDATFALGVDDVESASADVLAKPKRRVLEESVKASPWARGTQVLHVIPSSPATVGLDRPDASGEQLHTLRTALSKLDYDLVFIDAPPSLSALTRSALIASDRAIVVAEPSAFALNAAGRLFAAINEIRRREAGGLQPLGIVVNRYRAKVREHVTQLAAFDQLYGPLVIHPPIADRAVIQRAQGAREPLPTIGKDADAAAAFGEILSRIERAAKSAQGKSARSERPHSE